ncbi:hypothetical protein Q3G72_021279 [Acer saccharum]|nr:hypothetical protein Q3G72_021279 [Acer saccharum]
MVPQVPFVSLPADIPLLFPLMTALGIVIVILFCVMAVCMIATSFITIIIYVICNYVFWLCFDRYKRDVDQLGRVSPQSQMIITRRDNVFGGEAFRKQLWFIINHKGSFFEALRWLDGTRRWLYSFVKSYSVVKSYWKF